MTDSGPRVFEVDVLIQTPVTKRIEAADESAARALALAGQGEDVSGIDYTYGEVVDVREVEADADRPSPDDALV